MTGQITDYLYNLFLIGIPECIALTMLMLAFLKLPFTWKKVFFVAVIQTLVVMLFRVISNSLNFPGIHSAAAVITLGLLVSFYWQVSKVKAITWSILTMVSLGIFEIFYYKLFEIIFTISIDKIAQNKLYWLLGSWLHTISIIAIAVIITKTRWFKRDLHNKHAF